MKIFGSRILVLVPHPDDEVVGFAASIARVRAAGAEVFALYLTHGCVAREILWPWDRRKHAAFVARRRAEAESVARRMGVTPVGWSSRAARTVWRDLEAVRGEVARAVEAYKIDQLWVPAFEGGNADHDAVNAVAAGVGKNILKASLELLHPSPRIKYGAGSSPSRKGRGIRPRFVWSWFL